ncbi:uncharacterized protein LOC135086128 [Ostrinia nubilalis]|uniref:uncharacterized protein LOC135086128 n=1 Tax=Ostrinia nubilalis TaxID=29057 RepID=UPI00308259A7
MSETEEPPAKVAKLEMSQTFTQPEEPEEGQDEGQEEWLSEGLLTDDDCMPPADQDNSTISLPTDTENAPENQEPAPSEEPTQEAKDMMEDANIEKTLNSMDNSQSASIDPFDALLKDNQNINNEKEQSDGNDTDDLLRMLEDDDKTKKIKVLTKTKPKETPKDDAASSDDDDEYIFKGATVKKLKMAKNAVIQKYPASKAMPETSEDETDASSEDMHLMQKMFGKNAGNAQTSKAPQKQTLPSLKKTFTPKKIVRLGNNTNFRQAMEKRQAATSTPRPDSKSLLKNPQKSIVKVVDRSAVEKVKSEMRKPKIEHEEIINEEEFLEEDEFDLEEDFAMESDSELEKRKIKQRIMKPEQMDEEMLSDIESQSEDGSLYDELPTSDSDDMDEWFTLDIRAERAGDYLPLLGSRAHELLSGEKQRVGSRLRSLRQSLASLSAGGRAHASRLRAASRALAELDDVLRAH